MGKRIVILNGSPRKKGNTSALVLEFTRGAKEAGHAVTEFFLDSMDIHGCKGCFGGHSSRKCPCVQKDDMAQTSYSGEMVRNNQKVIVTIPGVGIADAVMGVAALRAAV